MVTLLIGADDRTCEADPPITVTVGRRSARDRGAPQYAAAQLSGPDPGGAGQRIAEVGQAVALSLDGQPRHRGRITDTALEHDDDGAVQGIISTGALAVWGRARIGDEPWPVESVADRAARIAAIVGLPLVVEGGDDLQVVGRDVDSKPGIDVLYELADSTGGWLWDDADGIVHLQALDARKIRSTTVLWSQEPDGQPWDALGAITWDGDDAPGPYAPIELDCTEVGWEPQWRQVLEFVNAVTVRWGPEPAEGGDRAEVTVRDEASIADLGESPVTVNSSLAVQGDALELAGLILTRSARPRWQLDSVEVDDLADLDPRTAARLMNAQPGARCTVLGMPQPAPYSAFPGVVEGWTETHAADGAVSMTLWLSHIEESLAVPTWDAEPPGQPWQDLSATITWEDDL